MAKKQTDLLPFCEVSKEQLEAWMSTVHLFFDKMYKTADIPKARVISATGCHERTLYAKRNNYKFETMARLVFFLTQAMNFTLNLNALLQAVIHCCREGKDLVIQPADPDAPLEPGQEKILAQKRKRKR